MNAFDEMYNPREEAKVIAMNLDEVSQYTYDKKRVLFEIPQPIQEKYLEAAKFLNNHRQVALVHIQHEFGIFGGSYGSHLIPLLRELKKPAVITFHTVLPGPNQELREVVRAINNHVQSIIAMTESSKQILVRDYALDESKIKVIPHGIHPAHFTDGKEAKRDLGLSKKLVISTFGLLSKGKGIQYGIEAMARVVKKFPHATYLIIGATHPVVLKNEGEAYRNTLIKKVHDLHLEHNVFFYNKYLKLEELLHFLEASDIYLALSQEPNQAVSGTLSYALGSGKPVVSTSFAQAKEDVTPETGILVDFTNVDQIAQALEDLLQNQEGRLMMGKSAYFRMRSRTWANVLLAHMAEYIRLEPVLGSVEKNIPRISLAHISTLTDGFGMIQFAKMTKPDPASGYTTDDNARALIALIKYYEKTGRKKALPLIQTYLNFLQYVERKEGAFHNYVDINKHIPLDQHQRENLESATARCMFALAKTATCRSLPEAMREQAATIFTRQIPNIENATSPRSMAYCIKALYAWSKRDTTGRSIQSAERFADKLVELFEKNREPNWRWFEDILAYSNGVMPDALTDAYMLTKKEKYLSIAREAFDFLLSYSFEGDMCVPIGQSGWFKRGGRKHAHDQQPEEVAVLVFTAKSMYRITGEEQYRKRMVDAFSWFLGNNTLHQVVYNQATGGCYDGVGEKGINLNQGAESTIMYLLARLSFE